MFHDAGSSPSTRTVGCCRTRTCSGSRTSWRCVKQLRGTAPAQVSGAEVAVYGGYTGDIREHPRSSPRTADGDQARRLPAPRRRRSARRRVLRRRRPWRARRSRAATRALRGAGTRRDAVRRATAATFTWTPSRGRGTFFSWAVVRRAFLPAFAEHGAVHHRARRARRRPDRAHRARYVVDVEPDALVADTPLEVAFRPLAFPTCPTAPSTVPMFVPARAVIYDGLRVVDLSTRNRRCVLRQAARPISARTSSFADAGRRGDPALRLPAHVAALLGPAAIRTRGSRRADIVIGGEPDVPRSSPARHRRRSRRSGTAAPTTASSSPKRCSRRAVGQSSSSHGHPNRPPLTVGGELGEYVTGAFAALGAVDGLAARVAAPGCPSTSTSRCSKRCSSRSRRSHAHGPLPRRASRARSAG